MSTADRRRLARIERDRASALQALGMIPEAQAHAAEAARLSTTANAAAAFAVGDAVTLRRQPDVSGVVSGVEQRTTPERPTPTWYYTTSWGSAYPAHELAPAPDL